MRFPASSSLSTTTRSIVPTSANRFLSPLASTSHSVAAMSSKTRAPENDAMSQAPHAKAESANQTQDESQTPHKQPLALPEAPSSSSTNQIDLSDGSGTVKLDHLGPMVVNADGTMSRIENWAQMTEIERANTLRVLGKRNQLRLKALREQRGEQQREGEGK